MRDPVTTSRKWEAGVALVLLCAAAALFVAVPNLVSGWAFAMPGTTDNALQPSFFPRLMLVLLGCAAIGVLVTGRSRTGAIPLVRTPRSEWTQLATLVVLVLVYFGGLFVAGFLPSSILFVAAAAYFVGFKQPVVAVLVGLLFPLCTYLVFRFAMSILLPTGLFG